MSRYTLKTLYNGNQVERFEHRPMTKIRPILLMPKHHMAGQRGPWGEELKHPDTFEVYDSLMTKIFHGNITEAIAFCKKLK